MNKIITISIVLSLSMAGCAQVPKGGDGANNTKQMAPATELTAEMLFDFLQGEIALQRNQPDIAAKSFTRLAEETRDPRVVEHATDIALRARRFDDARKAIDLWVSLVPDAVPARQAAVALYVAEDRLEAVRPHLKKLLELEPESVDKAFMQVNKLLSRHEDKRAVYQLIRKIAKPYPDLPEAHFAVSQAALVADQPKTASKAMQQALTLRPGWEMAAIHQGEALQQIDNAKAADFYQQYLQQFPAANDLRIGYIRMLMNEKDFAQAREQFQRLEEANPGNPDIALAIGLLSAEQEDYTGAEKYFERSLALGLADDSSGYFNLGRVRELAGRDQAAMRAYQKVLTGDRFIHAQIRYAFLLAKQDGIEAARQYLQTVRVTSHAQKIQLILAEAQLLRDAAAYRDAYDFLDEQLKHNPGYTELLYDRALMADKIDRLDILERDLRRLIQLKPDNAHAYNALGYSLAERGERLPEALILIQKAIELRPDDPYILDSMGWVYYRMGNLKKGLDYLKLAFSVRSDPEIAAHYGELLWMRGKKKDAEKIWQTALEEHPENELLLDTVKRFQK